MKDQNGVEFRFQVVVDARGEHSLRRASLGPPLGWRRLGTIGEKEDCLATIERAWADMTPRGLLQTGRRPEVTS